MQIFTRKSVPDDRKLVDYEDVVASYKRLANRADHTDWQGLLTELDKQIQSIVAAGKTGE